MTSGGPAGVKLLESAPDDGGPALVCLPCAGGAATSFTPVQRHLPPGWRMVAVNPPGHGFDRTPPLDRIDAMVDAFEATLGPLLDERAVIVGHSLGGLVAWHLVRRLEDRGGRIRALFVCASKGPQRVLDQAWSGLGDDALIAELDAIGGVPEVFRDNLEDFKPFLPAIRADFLALERYRHVDRGTVAAPMWVVAGADDGFASPNRVREWTSCGASAEFVVRPGGHFFLQSQAGAFVQWLMSVLDD